MHLIPEQNQTDKNSSNEKLNSKHLGAFQAKLKKKNYIHHETFENYMDITWIVTQTPIPNNLEEKIDAYVKANFYPYFGTDVKGKPYGTPELYPPTLKLIEVQNNNIIITRRVKPKDNFRQGLIMFWNPEFWIL